MRKILEIARREYIETVKTKTFIFMILMLPVMIAAIAFFAGRLDSRKVTSRQPIKIAVTDLSGRLSDKIVEDAFEEHNISNPNRSVELQEFQTSEKQGKDKLRRGEIDAYAVLDKDILEESGTIQLYTHEPRPAAAEALWTVENPLRAAVFRQRCSERGLSAQELNDLRKVPIERMELGAAGAADRVQSEADRMVRVLTPFFFMYLLFIGILTMGQQMLSSIIEEKSSRVIEVLLSAVSPFELMAGKILGLVAVGLTVVFLWGFSTCFVARWKGLNVDIGAAMLSCFVVYYVLAFFLFGSLMVGIGSICNTIKETQSLLKPVIILCVVPIIAWRNIIQDPNGTLARVLSYFPVTTPMVMILRLSSGTEIWIVETFLSIVVLAASVLGGVWVAARVFRTGILMYGKRPGLREVGRWLKQA